MVQIPGLRRLHLDFSGVPAELGLGSIIMHAVYLPLTNVDVAVEFEVPRSLDLWDNRDPSAQIRQLVKETPSSTNAVITASLAVRGFPGTLPAAVQATGSAMVCGYPVTFMNPEGEE
jgi:hypothetical protein